MFVRRDFAGGQMSRDMTLFVDKDGKAYHVHASEENMTLQFSELTDDYLDFTGKYFVFFRGIQMKPLQFFCRGKYFMFTSGTTGWKPNAARLSVATKITGEWKTIGNPCRGTEDENKNLLSVHRALRSYRYMAGKMPLSIWETDGSLRIWLIAGISGFPLSGKTAPR